MSEISKKGMEFLEQVRLFEEECKDAEKQGVDVIKIKAIRNKAIQDCLHIFNIQGLELPTNGK